VRDPLTTSAADVDEFHRASKRVVCQIGPIRPSDPDFSRPVSEAYVDRLKLCRDKGFDAVTFASPPPSAELAQRAAELGLPVVQR
jgi:hypothetical protein